MRINRAGLPTSARQAEEATVIDEARARAVRRVESTMRQLRHATQEAPPERGPHSAEDPGGPEMDAIRVPPTVTAVRRGIDSSTEAFGEPPRDDMEAGPDDAPAAIKEDTEDDVKDDAVEMEPDDERLRRLLAFVARQEPRLNWAVGDRADGTTILVTDFAHGWIPAGIELPEGVQLLKPERRTGRVLTLLGDTMRAATYSPGDSLGRSPDASATQPALQPRQLPAVEDLGWQLSEATHWRDGLPRMVHILAKAAAAGTGVVEEELDLLRVHLETQRHQLLLQYPDIEHGLMLNCLLLAATERLAADDPISANYHLAWFRKLDERPPSRWTANP